VSDGIASATDSVSVTIRFVNRPPIADAGAPQLVDEGAIVTLSAAGSTDPDLGTTLTYSWIQVAGPAVLLFDAGTVSPTFDAPAVSADTVLVFEVSVSDGTFSDTAAVAVTVNAAAAPPKDSGGCSCGSGAIDPSIAALIPLGLLFRRRRRR